MGRSTNARLLATCVALILTLALLPRAPAAAQADPAWTFTVERPHSVWSNEASWDVGTPVLVLVNDGVTGAEYAETVYVEPTGPNPSDVGWRLDTSPFEIEAGDVVTVEIAGDIKTHTVVPLAIDVVDPALDRIDGTGPADTTVDVYAHDGTVDAGRVVTVGADGTWIADFTTAPEAFDIRLGTWGGAATFDDDGDSTQATWDLPVPTIDVHAPGDVITGAYWEIGATVTASVDDPVTASSPDWTASTEVTPTSWDPNQGEIRFVTADEGFDTVPGHIVTVTDGTATKTHTVTELTITDVDVDTDLVTGVATAGALVEVTVHAPTEVRRCLLYTSDAADD